MKRSEKPFRQINGVDALFGKDLTAESDSQGTLSLAVIQTAARQPRRYFDPQKMAQLVESVRQHGVIESLLVRPLKEGSYELVAGERRYRAAKEVGLTEVPVTIRALNDWQALEIALIENLQREDLNPVEETEAVLQLLSGQLGTEVEESIALLYQMANDVKGNANHNVVVSEKGQLVQELFQKLGLLSWQSFISHRLPLLKLPADILEALRQGKIEYTKAKSVARIKDAEQRKVLLEEIVAQELSLTQVKERVNDFIRASAQTSFSDFQPIKKRIDSTLRLVRQSKSLDDPKKQRRLEKLLAQLEALVAETE